MVENGVYKIKDEFFDKFNDPKLSYNKGGRRPFFYCIKDVENEDIYWVVPMTSQVVKLKNILIRKFNNDPEKCDTFFINPFEKESAFLIVDAFPITKKYIEEKYIHSATKQHYIIKNKTIIKNVKEKLKKIIGLKNKGIKLIPETADIIHIKKVLIEELKNEI